MLITALCLSMLVACEVNHLYEADLLVSASYAGGWGGLPWWFADIDQSHVHVRIAEHDAPARTVDERALGLLRQTLETAKFFELPPVVGSLYPDVSACSMNVRLGRQQKAVTIGVLPVNATESERLFLRRALVVWDAVKAAASAGIQELGDKCHPENDTHDSTAS